MTDRIEGTLYRASVEPLRPTNEDSRQFEVSFSSPEPVVRSQFFDQPWKEILRHDADGVDLNKLNRGAPVLINHDLRSLPVGKVERAWIENGRGKATIRLSRRNAVQDVVNDIRDGIIENVSVGYEIQSRSLAYRGQDGQPDTYNVRWRPYEISISSVPQDSTVGFGRSANYPIIPLDDGGLSQPEAKTMPDETPKAVVTAAETPTTPVTANRAVEPEIDERALHNDWIKAERARVSGITAAFEPFGDQYRSLMDECRDDMNCTPENAMHRLHRRLVEDVGQQPLGNAVRAEMGETDGEKFLRGAEEALLVRSNLDIRNRDGGKIAEKPDLSGNEFSGLDLVDLCKIALQRSGASTTGTRMEVVGRAITHSTSDFPALMANVANKGLMRGFNYANETYSTWTRAGSTNDFKDVTRVGLGGVSPLLLVGEDSEYKHGTFAEYSEKNRVRTYGRILNLSRQMIVNDDLNGLARAPFLLGVRSAQVAGDLAYAVLSDNNNLSDGVPLFDSVRGNDDETPSAITTASVEKGRAGLGNFTAITDTGDDSEKITIIPEYLLCSHAKLGTARAVLSNDKWVGENLGTQYTSDNNIIQNIVMPIADRRIDGDNPLTWYLTPDGNLVDFVEMLYLDGRQTPFLERQEGWSVDGVELKIRFDVGVLPLAPHAWRNTGA